MAVTVNGASSLGTFETVTTTPPLVAPVGTVTVMLAVPQFDTLACTPLKVTKLALRYVPRLRSENSDVIDMFDRNLYEHRSYIRQNFEDLPEIANWSWTADFSEPAGPPPLAVGQPRAALFTDS